MKKEKLSTRLKLIATLIALDVLLLFAAVATENEYVSLTFGFFVFISGMWLLYSVATSIYYAIDSKNWIKTSYEVIGTQLSMEKSSRMHSHTKFIPYFEIQYQYKGSKFTLSTNENLNLSLKPIFSTVKDGQQYLAEVQGFKYGNYLYVNPINPDIAYLRTGVGRDQYGMLIFSISLIVLPFLTYAGLINWR
jgi:hypothetical protein